MSGYVAGAVVVGAGISAYGASKNADKGVKAQKKQNEANEKFIREQAINSRNDALPLYDAAQQNRGIGAQASLDVFGQSIPEQGRLLQEGNVMAQGALLAGLPQQNNALLGMPIDYSGLQPQQVNPDYSWAQQQVPQFQNPELRQRLNPGDVLDENGNIVAGAGQPPASFNAAQYATVLGGIGGVGGF